MLGEALALASALFLGLSSALVKNLTPRVNAVYLAHFGWSPAHFLPSEWLLQSGRWDLSLTCRRRR